MFKNIVYATCGTSLCTILGITTVTQYKSILSEKDKLNLVFDIDSTIIYTKKKKMVENVNNNFMKQPNYIFESDYQDNIYWTWRRPFSKFVLTYLSKFNNMYIFTASSQNYADPILNNLFENINFKQKLYKDDVENNIDDKEGKNLDKFKFDNNNSILIDDNKSNHINKNNNFYHIYPYSYLNKYDYEMIKLFGFVFTANLIGLDKAMVLYHRNILKKE